MNPQPVITEDGSSTLYIAALDEHYHSVHGALQESLHVFIHAGLMTKLYLQNRIDILEIGFGTGLNALLTGIEADKHQKSIYYTAVEKFPLSDAMLVSLNYGSLEALENKDAFFKEIHSCKWENETAVSPYFNLLKRKMNIEDISFSDKFDIIYFDAFAPSAQPELWTESIFHKMFNSLKPDGILVTYCAKGEVKRTMKKAGFIVEALPGPKGKREMTQCVKPRKTDE
jgi:tRNA U34 5-methylaminomethyl-2-thiouridine-forming methyltransferase MnmC